MDYKQKYIKYKTKYLSLKKQKGGKSDFASSLKYIKKHPQDYRNLQRGTTEDASLFRKLFERTMLKTTKKLKKKDKLYYFEFYNIICIYITYIYIYLITKLKPKSTRKIYESYVNKAVFYAFEKIINNKLKMGDKKFSKHFVGIEDEKYTLNMLKKYITEAMTKIPIWGILEKEKGKKYRNKAFLKHMKDELPKYISVYIDTFLEETVKMRMR